VCVLDNYAGTHFDIPDGADTEHSPDKLQLEQSHLAPSQLHAPDLIGILKALRSRPGLRETPVIFLMLRPPSPLQLQEFEPYRGLVYFVAVSFIVPFVSLFPYSRSPPGVTFRCV
jgi:hypothetical protein